MGHPFAFLVLILISNFTSHASFCSGLQSYGTCIEYQNKGCLWYSPPGICRLAPYCYSGWNETLCSLPENYGSCIYNTTSSLCQYRSTYLPTVNQGVPCLLPCGYPLVNSANQQCSFCGTQGICCDNKNPSGCLGDPNTNVDTCAQPFTGSPTKHPTNSPIFPSTSPTYIPSTSPITFSPSVVPTKAPSFRPTTFQPSTSPSTSTPTNSPLLSSPTHSPTFFPSSSPTIPTTFSPTPSPSVSSPSKSPISSNPTLSPTKNSPALAPTVFPTFNPPTMITPSPTEIPVDPLDQQIWLNFRAQYPFSSYCNNPGNACAACNSNDPYRKIVCGVVKSGRRQLAQEYLHILQIVMPQSNLTGKFSANILQGLPYLTVLDLSNNASIEGEPNILIYTQESCLPLSTCLNGVWECVLPSSLPPLCQNTTNELTTLTIIGIVLACLILFCCGFIFFCCGKEQLQKLKSFRIEKQNKKKPLDRKRSVSFDLKPHITTSKSPEWDEAYDEESGTIYWINRRTGAFSWHPPPGLAEEQGDKVIEPPKSILIHDPTGLPEIEVPPGWILITDEKSKTRYLLNHETKEFKPVVEPGQYAALQNRIRRHSSKFSIGSEGNDHDPLWKIERDQETGELYWIDIETGSISYVRPKNGTIVSAEMLAATGRYTRGQVEMKKTNSTPRNSLASRGNIGRTLSSRGGNYYNYDADSDVVQNQQYSLNRKDSSGIDSDDDKQQDDYYSDNDVEDDGEGEHYFTGGGVDDYYDEYIEENDIPQQHGR